LDEVKPNIHLFGFETVIFTVSKSHKDALFEGYSLEYGEVSCKRLFRNVLTAKIQIDLEGKVTVP
jgi:hypothetical protein